MLRRTWEHGAWWTGFATLSWVLFDGWLTWMGAYGWRGQEGRFILAMRTWEPLTVEVLSIAVNDTALTDRDLVTAPTMATPVALRRPDHPWRTFRVISRPGQALAVITVTARDGTGAMRVVERPVVPEVFAPCVVHVEFTPQRFSMTSCLHDVSVERW